MRLKHFFLFLCVSSIAVAGFCGDNFWAQATLVKGVVKFRPMGGNSESDLKLGAVLHKGDTVITGERSRASFLLNDGSIKVVNEKSNVVLTSEKESGNAALKAVAQNLSKTLLSREGNNPMLKHLGGLRGAEKNVVLGPNRTKVRTEGLVLNWLPTRGCSKYVVTLMGPGDMIFEAPSEKTSLEVPKEKLSPSATYYWEIRNALDKDSITALGSGSFTTLDKKDELAVKGLEDNIASAMAGAPDQSVQASMLFLLYQVYRGYGLDFEALLTAGRILETDKDYPDMLRIRQELCRELGISETDLGALKTDKNG